MLHFVANGPHDFEINCFRKTFFSEFYQFVFLAIIILVSLMRGLMPHMPRFWHSKKAQSNKF